MSEEWKLKIRYTWKRGSDGNILQRIVDLESLEEKGLALDFSGYRLIARDLFTGIIDAALKEIYENDIVTRGGITKKVKWRVGRSAVGWNIGEGYNYRRKTIRVIGNIHLNPELA